MSTEDITVSLFETLPSTNTYLKDKAISGEKEGAVVVSFSQTEGRGRFNRKFHSENGGIYMSILLRPETIGLDTTLITTAAAVAVCEAIEALSENETMIKWVNDVLINGKKVCGILCEGGFQGDNTFIIVGIGINFAPNKNGFNDEIKNIATTVFDKWDDNLYATLTVNVINNFFKYYNNIASRDFLETYRQKNAVLNKKITVISQNGDIPATALEIDDNCRLLVELENGEKQYLSSGEISIKI